MDALLEQIQETPVSIGFLKRRVPPGVTVIALRQLKGKSRAQLFSRRKPVVVLIPKKGERIGHFIVLIPRERTIEYFSSLGNSPQSELAALREPRDEMMRILGSNPVYNRTKLQGGAYSVNDCAAWVLARVILWKLKLRDFISLFRRKVLRGPDELVAVLTLLHFVDQ